MVGNVPWMTFLSWYADNLEGLDDLLSKHISHLFIRDPIVVFSETIDQDNSASTDHFEVNMHVFSDSFLKVSHARD